MAGKTRQSNLEILRIIAMFLVLLVHADFFSLGAPTVEDCVNNTLDAALRVYFQAISIICVNIFICISGWFGIRATMKGFCNFIFQCLFWLIGLYLIAMTIGTATLSTEGLKGCLVLTRLNWFIKAYILLYILSPVLNAFVEHASREVFKNVLIGFFVFQTVYGWLFSESTSHLQGGYSTISFIGLYLLMRYLRVYKPAITQISKKRYARVIIGMPILISVCYTTPPVAGLHTSVLGSMWITNYISPYSICLAVTMVLLFSKLQIRHMPLINRIAASSFAVFLIHTNPNTVRYFQDFIIYLYQNFPMAGFWLITFLFLSAVFAIAVIIDQIRIRLWNNLWNRFEFSGKQNDSNSR